MRSSRLLPLLLLGACGVSLPMWSTAPADADALPFDVSGFEPVEAEPALTTRPHWDSAFDTGGVPRPRLAFTQWCSATNTLADIELSNFTPNGRYVLLEANRQGFRDVPAGVRCAGTTSFLGGAVRMVANGRADAAGTGDLVGLDICNRFIQIIDMGSCRFTSVGRSTTP